jgi:hypothetical protein
MIHQIRIDYHRLLRLILILGMLLAIGVQMVPGQTRPSNRTGLISGRVTTEEGQPVAGVTVQLSGTGISRSAVTDAEGGFNFSGLVPMIYRIYASAPGYVNASESGGDTIMARVGESIDVTLIKGGVITGRVTDSNGEPAVIVTVSAIRVRDGEGRPLKNQSIGRQRLTDDRGIYRHYGLQAGSYLIVVNPTKGDSTRVTAYDQDAPTYHPSSPREGATEVTVQPGTEVTGIDIRYRSVRGHVVAGTVEVVGNVNEFGLQVEIHVGGSMCCVTYPRMTGESRGFYFDGVPDGDYEVVARANQDGGWVSIPRRITVRGADVIGVKLSLVPMGSIAGKVVVESTALPEDCQRERESSLNEIYIQPQREEKNGESEAIGVSASRQGVAVKDGGDFTLNYLVAGQYRLEPDLPSEKWYLKRLTMPGTTAARRLIDLSQNGLVLKAGEKLTGVVMTVGEGAAAIDGKIEGEKVKRGERFRIHLVPVETAQADQQLLYYEAVIKTNGTFSLTHLAPGKYWAVVRPIPDDQPLGQFIKPAASDAAERAKLRREAEAAKQEVELKTCQRMKDYMVRVPL